MEKGKIRSLFIRLFILASACSFSQNSISGFIIDGITQKPIEGASIFFNNTTIGTTSNSDGKFYMEVSSEITSKLVISHIGYKTEYLEDYSVKSINLYPIQEALEEVVITAKKPWSRELKLREFRKHYLGQSINGRSCKIVNEDAIVLTYNSKKKQLRAKANAPIIIRNFNLKYTITVNLNHFEVNYSSVSKNKKNLNVKNVHYVGANFFQSLETSPSFKTKQKRKKVFKGSRLHFMRALLKNKLRINGFDLYVGNKSVLPSSHISRIPVPNGVGVWISLNGPLNVLYEGEQKSNISSLVDEFYIDAYGNHSHPNAVKFGGRFSKQRMGDALPLDYNIDDPEENVQSTPKNQQKEIAFAHLNKSTYIKGESLGFTTYILNRETKEPFKETRNLYCVITNKNDSIIKGKLIRVENGIANSVFQLDDAFNSGDYVFKTYTNHMRNFNGRNYYSQQIKIIDPEEDQGIKRKIILSDIDAQFLPEGGHLIVNTPNVVGVVIKDSLGFGVSDVRGTLKDSRGTIVTPFSVNQFGIGKFLFTPEIDKKYYAEIDFNDKTSRFAIENAQDKGINIQLTDLENKVALTFSTNKQTLAKINKNKYRLVISNDNDKKEIPLSFNEQTQVIKIINHIDLFSGINLFTLFDDNNNAILERLFFNNKGINISKSTTHSVSHKNDSISISLAFSDIDTGAFNNLSISVLPKRTKTYNHHHNIISYVHLQPYLKGYIENAQYYFKNINKKKKYELDNLLLTQGWSSYNWDNIFNNPSTKNHPFETGISIKALVKNQKRQRFLVHSINHSQPNVLSITKNDKGFYIPNTYLRDIDTLKISKLKLGGSLIHSNLTLEFSPYKIPSVNSSLSILKYKDYDLNYGIKPKPFTIIDLKKTQQLDEVVVTGKKNEARNMKIIGKAQRNVDFFSEEHSTTTFMQYLQTKGMMYYMPPQPPGIYGYPHIDPDTEILVNQSSKRTASIYIDDLRIRNPSSAMDELKYLTLDKFDYVIINRNKPDFPESNSTEITRGGIIKIKMRDNYIFKDTRKRSTIYKAPLTYNTKKTFYVPKYQSYQDDFFNAYGVTDWFPVNKVGADGNIHIKFQDHFVSGVKLFIEGIANDGGFVSEVKTIKLNYKTKKNKQKL